MNDIARSPISSAEQKNAPAPCLSDRIRALVPQISAAATKTEADRRVSEDIIEALKRAGMFRVYVPKPYGGTEESIIEVCKCIRMVARACPSTAWVIAVLCAHPFITSLYSKQMQDEFWADGPDTLCSTSGFPANRGKIVEGGVVVSGRYPFSSGCLHASWAMIGVSVPDITRPNPERMRTAHFCIVPRSDYTIDDDWNVMGLAGTASRTLVFNDVFIPSHRMEVSAAMTGRWTRGEGMHKGWLWNAGYGATIGTALTPVMLGIADTMLELMTKRIRGKTVPTTRIPLNSIPNSMRLAESTHELRAVSLFWDDHLARIEEQARAGILPDEDTSADSSAAGVYVQEVCTRLVDRLFAVSGGSAIRHDNPLQRFFRDAHVARAHFAAEYDAAAQAYGRYLLGLPGGRFGA
jgi:4-hydroxyphenylacetate 3-monooxygenase